MRRSGGGCHRRAGGSLCSGLSSGGICERDGTHREATADAAAAVGGSLNEWLSTSIGLLRGLSASIGLLRRCQSQKSTPSGLLRVCSSIPLGSPSLCERPPWRRKAPRRRSSTFSEGSIRPKRYDKVREGVRRLEKV